MDQAAARDSADWRPVLQEFDPGLQDRLRTLLSAEVAPQWAELWEGARRAADAQAAVVTADEVLVHLRDVERELRDRLGKDSPAALEHGTRSGCLPARGSAISLVHSEETSPLPRLQRTWPEGLGLSQTACLGTLSVHSLAI